MTHPWQFESWMTRRAEKEKLTPEDRRYRSGAQIADAVLAGRIPDPTAGATHFLNPTIVAQRRGTSLRSWATGNGLSIGRHTFFAPDTLFFAPDTLASASVTRPSVVSCWPGGSLPAN
ncbi:MAG: cell wall hydrolase [Methyloceanibacter sp.]